MQQDRSLVSAVAGCLLCALGLFVISGWIMGNQAMVRIVPGSVAMSINTALMFLVAGCCLVARARHFEARRAIEAGAWFIIALSLAILSEHLFDIDLPIDLAGVHDALGDGHAKPGRTAPNACAGFLLAGIALQLSMRATQSAALARLGAVLAALTLIIGVAGFVGYVLRLDMMYQIATYNRMAAFTAIGMTMLGAGLWALAPAHAFGWNDARDEAQRITKLAAALLMVFALATGLVSFAVLRDSFEKAAADNHLLTARTTAISISLLLEQTALLSTSVARRAALGAPLQRLIEAPGDPLALAQLAEHAHVFDEMAFSATNITGADGRLLVSRGSMNPATGPMRVQFDASGSVASLGWNGGFFLQVAHRLEHDGRLIGMVLTEQRLRALDTFLAESRKASASTDVVLCTRSARQALCFPSRFYSRGATLAMFKRDGSPALPIARALLGQSGSASLKDPRGTVVLAGYTPVPRQQLGIVVENDARELYIPLRDKLHVLVLAVLLFVALGVLLLGRWMQPLVARLVEERQRIQAILDNSNDAFIGIGPDGKITDWNKQAEKTLGWATADAVGRDLAELIIPAAQREAHNAGFKRFLACGHGPAINNRLEVSALHALGHEIPVELSVTAMQMGAAYGASAFLRDLSERKAAEASAADNAAALESARLALAQSQKLEAVGKLTGGVAHDFNNVLQVVKGSIELLRHEQRDAPAIISRLDTAAGAVERGAKLASQLLAFARKQPLQPKACDLGRVVRSMQDMLRGALGDAIEIAVAVEEPLWNTLVDPNQLEHVILNLAINARDAMHGEGRLSVKVGNAGAHDAISRTIPELIDGQFVMLAIADTGVGMTPDTMEKAFEPFFSTKPEGQGTGLGLSMTYGFVKQSGGHIDITSEPGAGTTVRLYLPRTLDGETLDAPELPGDVTGGSETVLVVEDDEAVQATAVALLAGLGYRVLKADNASAALRMMEAGADVDLLFTDVVMPGELRSPELARRARLLLPGLQVLFTSGYTQDAIMHDGRLDPGLHLLSKPYGREQLARKVRSLLTPPPSVAVDPAPHGTALRVAFVEDNDDFRMLGSELIAIAGRDTSCFANGEEALEQLDPARFDVLITDIGLPGMSGLALAAEVHRRWPAIRIVLASGYGDRYAGNTAFPCQVLTKPFTLEQLRDCLAPAETL